MPHADQKYIDALLTNNIPVLHELYQNFSGKIKAMVLHNRGTEGDARDIFQEALLAIYKKARANGFTLQCPLEAFLYLVCKNKWLSELHRRHQGRVTFRDTERYSLEETSLDLSEAVEREQQRAVLFYKKLALLGQNCRQLLLLSWKKKDMQEVAGLLRISYGYARKKKSECMARLIHLIQTDPDFENLKGKTHEQKRH